MRLKQLFLLFAVAILMVATSCVEDSHTDTPTPPSTEDPTAKSIFDVEISDVTRSTVTFSVRPENLEGDYLCIIKEAEEVDEFLKDEYIVTTIFQELSNVAYEMGKTLEEYMTQVVNRGVLESVTYSGLDIDAEYYILVFGVDAADYYNCNTELVKCGFKTLAVEQMECTFEVNTTVKDNNVVFNVKPSDKEILWYLCTMTKDQYDYYTSESGYGMTENYFYEYFFQQDINAYLQAGYSESEIVEALIHSGDLTLEAKGLKEKSTYYYLIAGLILDSEGIVITTPITKGEFVTEGAEKSSMTFDIEVWDIGQLSASVRITPSNNNEKYCALIQPWDGVTEAQDLMHKLVEQWGGWMDIMADDKGVVEHSGSNAFQLPAPDTYYYVIAFGYNGGITTDAYMKTFKTLPGGSVEEVEFTITTNSVSPYGFKMNIKSSDPTIYYLPGACKRENYNEEEFKRLERENFDYIFEETYKFNPSITIAELLDQYYYRGDVSVEVSGLDPDTEIMGYIMVLDIHTADVVRCITFDNIAHTDTLGITAPEVELVGYYSGDDENGTIFNDKSATQGRVITVVKYNNLDNVRTLFTTMVEGDCSNLTTYSDAEIWSLTTGYWSTCSVNQPYTFYLVDWNVEQTALAYATDNSGKVGTIGRLLTLPTADNKGDIEELRELYNSLKETRSCGVELESVVVKM